MIELKHIYKSFDGNRVLDDLSLTFAERELVCMIGPMGCGKSTLLRCLAGLVDPDSGEIRFTSGEKPRIGMILQDFNLFPFLNVLHNLTLAPMRVLGMSAAEAERLALEQLESVGLAHKSHLFPQDLSVGQQQRVAIARCLVMKPRVLLLDEPFSALDYQTKLNVCDDVHSIITNEKQTVIAVTHDISEAISMSDRIVILTQRPAKVKKIQNIGLQDIKTPLKRRESTEFAKYFDLIWKELSNEKKEETS